LVTPLLRVCVCDKQWVRQFVRSFDWDKQTISLSFHRFLILRHVLFSSFYFSFYFSSFYFSTGYRFSFKCWCCRFWVDDSTNATSNVNLFSISFNHPRKTFNSKHNLSQASRAFCSTRSVQLFCSFKWGYQPISSYSTYTNAKISQTSFVRWYSVAVTQTIIICNMLKEFVGNWIFTVFWHVGTALVFLVML